MPPVHVAVERSIKNVVSNKYQKLENLEIPLKNYISKHKLHLNGLTTAKHIYVLIAISKVFPQTF